MNRDSVRFLLAGLLAVFLLLPTGSRATAATIPYGDFTGTDFMFLDVTEDTRDEPNALYGEPSSVANRLDFDPIAYYSASNSTTPSEIVDGQLNFTVMSMGGGPISEIMITEAGDYTLAGLGSAQATADAMATVFWTVTHVGGSPLGTPIGDSAVVPMSPNGGSYSLTDDSGTASWSGSLTLDVGAFLAANSVAGPATKVEIVIDNTLETAAANGGSAFIAKKDFGVMVMVPEPTSLGLLLAAMAGCFAMLRRR